MDILTIGRIVFKATLEADPTYASLMAWEGTTKTFGSQVHANVPLPYVTVEHYTGGLENDAINTDAADMLWMITAHTEDNEAQALSINAVINAALHKKQAVMGSITAYKAYDLIRLQYPFFDRLPRQNRIFFKVGGLYRLRIAEVKT